MTSRPCGSNATSNGNRTPPAARCAAVSARQSVSVIARCPSASSGLMRASWRHASSRVIDGGRSRPIASSAAVTAASLVENPRSGCCSRTVLSTRSISCCSACFVMTGAAWAACPNSRKANKLVTAKCNGYICFLGVCNVASSGTIGYCTNNHIVKLSNWQRLHTIVPPLCRRV
jgi:hypothetical protein